MQFDNSELVKNGFKEKIKNRLTALDFFRDENKRTIAILTIAAVSLILTFIFIGLTPRNFDFNFPRRVRKVLAMALTGASIAFSSVAFQTITNNRVLTPSILGLDSLYMFIQTLVIFFFGSANILAANKNINFLVCLVLMVGFSGVLYRIMFKGEEKNIYFLLLIGMIFGSFFGSLSSFMQNLIDPNEFLIVQDKMFASFSNVNTSILTISIAILIILAFWVYDDIKYLDVLSLGRDQAINLGVDYNRIVKKFMIIVAILVSISTALVGPITFLGILVVNLAKELMKSYKHIYWFAAAGLISIIALVGGQLLVERVFSFSTNLSVIINFVGGCYFVFLLLKESKA